MYLETLEWIDYIHIHSHLWNGTQKSYASQSFIWPVWILSLLGDSNVMFSNERNYTFQSLSWRLLILISLKANIAIRVTVFTDIFCLCRVLWDLFGLVAIILKCFSNYIYVISISKNHVNVMPQLLNCKTIVNILFILCIQICFSWEIIRAW